MATSDLGVEALRKEFAEMRADLEQTRADLQQTRADLQEMRDAFGKTNSGLSDAIEVLTMKTEKSIGELALKTGSLIEDMRSNDGSRDRDGSGHDKSDYTKGSHGKGGKANDYAKGGKANDYAKGGKAGKGGKSDSYIPTYLWIGFALLVEAVPEIEEHMGAFAEYYRNKCFSRLSSTNKVETDEMCFFRILYTALGCHVNPEDEVTEGKENFRKITLRNMKWVLQSGRLGRTNYEGVFASIPHEDHLIWKTMEAMVKILDESIM